MGDDEEMAVCVVVVVVVAVVVAVVVTSPPALIAVEIRVEVGIRLSYLGGEDSGAKMTGAGRCGIDNDGGGDGVVDEDGAESDGGRSVKGIPSSIPS